MAPSVSVLVPLAVGHDPTRDHNWRWLRQHWEHHHPTYQLCEGHAPAERWCKATAVQDAAARATGDVWVICDADLLISPQAVTQAVSQATDANWVVPAHNIYRLTPEATADHLGTPPEDHQLPPRTPDRHLKSYVLVPGGGCLILTTDTYRRSGGFDPRFIGWGGEDRALGHALETIAGEPTRIDTGEAWHLWHRPSWPKTRRMNDGNDRLARRYISARGDLDSMSALIKEHT